MLNLWNMLDDVMRADPWFRPFLTGPESDRASSWPLVDVVEADSAYLINAELPGVKLEDVKIEIEKNVLTLTAQKQPESAGEGGGYHRIERNYGMFRRSFVLPQAVTVEEVQATMKDGVLTIHLPKTQQARPRRIPIHAVAPTNGGPPAQITAEASESSSAQVAEGAE